MAKRKNYGTTFFVDHNGDSTYTQIGTIRNVSKIGGGSADKVDTTAYSDTFKTCQKGQIEPGSYEFEINEDPAEAVNVILRDLYNGDDNVNWKVILPDVGDGTSERVFNGYVSSYETDYDVKGAHVSSITVEISGDPGL